MKKNNHHEIKPAAKLKDFILGAQDGLVNVLGLVLGVASATFDTRIVLISGLAGLFAESISMGAVAYTSSKAAKDYYDSEVLREEREIKEVPKEEKREIETLYRKKGFKGEGLAYAVQKITSNRRVWVETMMSEELKLSKEEYKNPIGTGFFVFFSTMIGSIVPLIPFFLVSVKTGIIASVILCGIALFAIGATKAKLTIGDWKKSGMEMLTVGLLAAATGYIIGMILGSIIGTQVLL